MRSVIGSLSPRNDTMSETRKLAASLAADVVGYSRLMGEDEAGTAWAVRERREAAEPIVADHGGRIVKTTGDGLLMEFPSVVAAADCAMQHVIFVSKMIWGLSLYLEKGSFAEQTRANWKRQSNAAGALPRWRAPKGNGFVSLVAFEHARRHCHVGKFYLSMARRAYGSHAAKSMACRVREWRWTPRESAILGRRLLDAPSITQNLGAKTRPWRRRTSAIQAAVDQTKSCVTQFCEDFLGRL